MGEEKGGLAAVGEGKGSLGDMRAGGKEPSTWWEKRKGSLAAGGRGERGSSRKGA